MWPFKKKSCIKNCTFVSDGDCLVISPHCKDVRIEDCYFTSTAGGTALRLVAPEEVEFELSKAP